MKRYGIYITVILIFLSGLYRGGYSQDNSDIDLLDLTYPTYDTLNDPAYDSVIVKIDLDDYAYWGKFPPDNIGFFSLNNNYSWTEKNVTNTTEFLPEYKSVSPVYLFDQEVNQICFWLYDQTGDHNFDSTRCFNIYYNKPQVELLDVEPSEKVTGHEIYVINESNPELVINARSLFPSTNVNSFITKIDLREESSSFWENLWTNASGLSETELTIALPGTFSIEPGMTKTFYLRSTGRTAPGYSGPMEISDEFAFTLTYMYINFPDTICRVNTNVSLDALPLGGEFEGKGIVANTSYFNPSLADANAYNLVTYNYSIEGSEFSLSEPIYVVNLPAIQLQGDLEVWANSTDVKYTILNAETSKYVYNWEFTGVDEILESTDISRTVRWEADPASYIGKILISLESKNETQFCPAAFEYLVDIDPDMAPDKPCVCFGDISRRLLLSSNIQATYYKWFTSEGDSIGFTETPYYFLTDAVIKDYFIDNATTYYVSIANQLTGGYTTGYMCAEETCPGAMQNNLLVNKSGEELSVVVLNNPVHGELILRTSGNYSGRMDVEVYSVNGALISSSRLNKAFPSEEHKANLDTELMPGIYLVICHYGNSHTAPVKLIVY
jgi:hypothetical protein